MITGRCACNTVRFSSRGEVIMAHHCHCRTCRSIHGTVFGSTAVVPRSGFEVTTGAQHVGFFESSPGKRRGFCVLCGTHVYVDNDATPETVSLRIGTLDEGHGIKPARHIWTSDAPSWYEIGGALPQVETS